MGVLDLDFFVVGVVSGVLNRSSMELRLILRRPWPGDFLNGDVDFLGD